MANEYGRVYKEYGTPATSKAEGSATITAGSYTTNATAIGCTAGVEIRWVKAGAYPTQNAKARLLQDIEMIKDYISNPRFDPFLPADGNAR